MSKVPESVIQDWKKNKKRIQDRLNRIKKRLKKLQKQEKHFEMRLRMVKDYEKANQEGTGKEVIDKEEKLQSQAPQS